MSGWTYTITFAKMRELPVGLRMKMRELTIGPVAWGLWSLTFHDGSTWAALAYKGLPDADNLIGWAAMTQEYDYLPMVGVYVGEDYRGKGLASTLVTTLLQTLLDSRILNPGDTFVSSTERWPKYFELAERCGLKCQLWE